jgi:hypothetical protein
LTSYHSVLREVKVASFKKPCSDCQALETGRRYWAEPHEYLLRTDSHGYHCLICDTHLVCQHLGESTVWSVQERVMEPAGRYPSPRVLHL